MIICGSACCTIRCAGIQHGLKPCDNAPDVEAAKNLVIISYTD